MTNEEIDALQEGRELDALVAEKVMGWQWSGKWLVPPADSPMLTWAAEWVDGLPHWLPNYSTSVTSAWDIVEAFRRGWNHHAAAVINLVITDDIDPEDCYCDMGSPDIRDQHAVGRNMPEAICKCALKVALWSESHVQNLPPQ